MAEPDLFRAVARSMVRVSDEPKSWPEGEDHQGVLGSLRHGIEQAKARLAEHRDQMLAAGLARPTDEGERSEAER